MNGIFRLSVRLSFRPSVTPFWLCSHHLIIRIFSGVFTSDRSDVLANGQGQRSKVKVTEVTTQLNRFRTVTPVWIPIWWWNDAYSLIMLRRGALLFFKFIRQIARSHGSKNRRFWPKLGVSGLYLQFGITDGYEMMHKAWSSIGEVPCCFSRSSVKFEGHTALKIVEFVPNWAFPDCNSSLNSPMAMKCCTKLETANERCPIVFQGHPSNFKVTRDKISSILTQIGRFRTIGRSQLSNPSDLPCSNFVLWSVLFLWRFSHNPSRGAATGKSMRVGGRSHPAAHHSLPN